MKTISILAVTCLAASLLLLSASAVPVIAQPWVYNLYGANELPDGISYGTVSLSYIYDGGRRGVRMTVTADQSILSPCNNFGIQRFGFNTTLSTQPDDCAGGDTDGDGVSDCVDNCVNHPNGPQSGTCTRGMVGAACMNHSDCGSGGFCSRAQEDTYPPPGNKYGNACECEGNFDRDQDVDGSDAFVFKEDFGRYPIKNPCTDEAPCYGDFEEDADVDGSDAIKFKEDFGRGNDRNTCPSFWADIRMTLPPEWKGTFGNYQFSEFGRFQIDARGDGSSRVNPLVIDIYHQTENLFYTDFVVPNAMDQYFALHAADFIYQGSECMSGFFSSPGGGPLTTTTSVKTTSTTSSILTTSTTTSEPTTTTTEPTTTTSVSTTTSSVPVITTSTTTSTPASTTIPTTTTSVSTTTTSQPTSTTTAPTTTTVSPLCQGEIYKGGTCDLGLPIDDPAYNRPGRRGLSLTCEDIVDFCICSDCVNLDPACLVWSIDPAEPYLSIVANPNGTARLTVGESCDQLEEIREYTVTVTDTCNGWSDSVALELGKVTIDAQDIVIQQGSDSFMVPVKLVNRYNTVRALSVDLCACDGGDDRVVCNGCVSDSNRALDFTCLAAELDDGCCRVLLYTSNPASLILQGSGPVFNVIYEGGDAFDGCTCVRPDNRQVSDQFNEELCACQSTGDLCFKSCGDVYPRDCLDPDCATCGDNAVDLYDVLEVIDMVLGLSTPTACQLEHGDVPNGMPPYCGEPSGTLNCESDGVIDMLDVLVIIDMAQGRANCCDYCLFKRIF